MSKEAEEKLLHRLLGEIAYSIDEMGYGSEKIGFARLAKPLPADFIMEIGESIKSYAEAYHQERKKAASNNIEFFGQCRYGQFGCDFVCVRHIVNDQINGGRYIEGLVNDLSAGDVGAMRAFDELLILEAMKIVNIERFHAGEPLTEINATHSPVNDVTTPPLKESGTGASVCNRLGCNMDKGRGPVSREQLNKHFDAWAKAKGLIK